MSDYENPPEGHRETPVDVPGTDECAWTERKMGEGYADDIDEVGDLPEIDYD